MPDRFSFVGCLVFLAMSAGNLRAGLINPGFETGDLAGWTTRLSGGSAAVVSSEIANASKYRASGAYFLQLTAGTGDVWQTVSQSVSLNAGNQLSGWAAFDWRDYAPFDDGARVRILDSSLNEIAVPYYRDGNSQPTYADTPPSFWSFTALVDDVYTLEYGVRNTGDSALSIIGLFDDGSIRQTGIPEPTSIALALIAAVSGVLHFQVRRLFPRVVLTAPQFP